MAEDQQQVAHKWASAVEILVRGDQLSGTQLGFVRLARPLGVLDGTALLAVPSEFAKDFLETKARDHLVDALSLAFERGIHGDGETHGAREGLPRDQGA